MKRVKYSIERESTDEQVEAGRFNPCLKLTFRDKTGIHTHKIGAGYSDEIDVYREDQETFVLTRNSGLGYVGLEIFNGPAPVGEMFIQNDLGIEEIVGNINFAPYTVIKRMAQYIY